MLVELENGHEFDAVDTEGAEVGNFFAEAGEGTRMTHSGRGVPGEAAEVHLVDDQIRDCQIERAVVFPVEIIFRKAASVRKNVVAWGDLAKDRAPTDRSGEGVKEDTPSIESVAGAGVEGAVHAIAVLDPVGLEVKDHHGEDVTHAKFWREGDLGEGLRRP